jgi:ribonuclease HII
VVQNLCKKNKHHKQNKNRAMRYFWPKVESLLKLFHQTEKIEAGCDEAGRGCLAGPVFAAAVILPEGFYHEKLNDSKQVNEETRYELRAFIEKHAVSYQVAMVDHEEIDRINILNASFKAMHLAIDKLKTKAKYLIIDGNRFTKYKRVPHACIIQGDGIYASIAAASILAKTYRDDFMRNLANDFPHYKWHTNKGYGTIEHRRAIEQFGLSPFHRKTFNWKSNQLELEMEA